MDIHEDIIDLEARYRTMAHDPARNTADFVELSLAFGRRVIDLDPERAEQVLAGALEAMSDPPTSDQSEVALAVIRTLARVSGQLGHDVVQFDAFDRERRITMSTVPLDRAALLALRRRSASALLLSGRAEEGFGELVHAIGDACALDDDEEFGFVVFDIIAAGRAHDLSEALASSIERILVGVRQAHPARRRVLWCLIGVIALRLTRGDREGARIYVNRLSETAQLVDLPVAAHLVIGWSLMADDHPTLALDAFEAAADLAVHDPRMRFLLAASYGEAAWMAGLMTEARAALAEATSYSVGDLRTLARCHEQLSELAVAEDRHDDAVQHLQLTRRYEKELRREGVIGNEAQVIDLRDRRLRSLEQLVDDRTRELEQALVALRDLNHRSRFDELTGLVNRHHVVDVLAERLAAHETVGVLAIGIDRFTRINESLGHAVGDALLVELAHRLEHMLDAADVVARWGGDEFVVLLCGVRDGGAAVLVAEVIRQRLGVAWSGLPDVSLVPSVTIGVAISEDDPGDPERLLRQADLALDQAKSKGKGRVEVFGDSLGDASRRRFDAEMLVRSALENDWFELYYQPVYSNATGRPSAAEALIRIAHPELGLLPPAVFLDVVEETGLAIPVGEWVFDTACRALARWQQVGRWFRLSVNVSANQLDHRLPGVVAGCLARAGAHPEGLVIELTEHALLEADETQVAVMLAIRELGVRIALDDFGTAYSSFSHLRQFPIDFVKIDRSFVAGICLNPQDEAIVRAVVDLSRSFDFRVIAEGIESTDQLDRQRLLGCHAAQGYLIGRPMTNAVFTDLLTGLPMLDRLLSDAAAALN